MLKLKSTEREIFMKNLQLVFSQFMKSELKLSTRGNSPTINQTMRNKWKAELENALKNDLQEMFTNLSEDYQVGKITDGIVASIFHEKIDQEVPFHFEVKIKNLDFDTAWEIEAYESERIEKEKQAKIKEEAKKAKIARDKAMYEKKALEKLAKIGE